MVRALNDIFLVAKKLPNEEFTVSLSIERILISSLFSPY